MDKSAGRKTLLFLNLLLLASGCGYHLVNHRSDNRLYLAALANDTLQPQLEIYVLDGLKEKILDYPGFLLVSNQSQADWLVTGRITRFEREPLFFSPQDADKIVLAKFTVGLNLKVGKPGCAFREETVEEHVAVALTPSYQEEEMLEKIGRQVADKVFFRLLKMYEEKTD